MPQESDRAALRLVSGGQTGVDRAALDAARALGIPQGGWCPRGRRAEDGVIPPEYPLNELLEFTYAARTRRNVEDSDATLILCRGPLSGGTLLTYNIAVRLGKPLLVVELELDRRGGTREAPKGADETMAESLEFARRRIVDWLAEQQVRVLNVAGPRASSDPGIGGLTFELLQLALRPWRDAAGDADETSE